MPDEVQPQPSPAEVAKMLKAKAELEAKAIANAQETARHQAEVRAEAEKHAAEPAAIAAAQGRANEAAMSAMAKAFAEVTLGRANHAHATEGLNQTIPGGKFRVKPNGSTITKLVNAHGEEIDEDGSLIHPERVRRGVWG